MEFCWAFNLSWVLGELLPAAEGGELGLGPGQHAVGLAQLLLEEFAAPDRLLLGMTGYSAA